MEENNYEVEVMDNNEVEEYEETGNGILNLAIGAGLGVAGTLLVKKGISKFKEWRKRKKEEVEVVDGSEAEGAVHVDCKVVDEPDDENEE